MSAITIIGSLNYDLVTFTNKVPEGGETYEANSFENHLGGKGLNEALASARLIEPKSPVNVRMVGNVGNDSFGKELKQALVDSKVDTTHIKTLDGVSSGVAVILVESSGENRILITPGANGQLKPSEENYRSYFPNEDEAGFVILQNEYPDTIKTISWIKENRPRINIAYNPSPFKPELVTSEILGKIDLLIVNEGEALDVGSHILPKEELGHFKNTISQDKVAGFSQLATTLEKAINKSNVNTVVITMGSLGSVIASLSLAKPSFYASRKVDQVVDTTGAGDTFFGGIVLKLAVGAPIDEAVEFATAASSLVIQKKGAAESIPSYEEVQKHLNRS